MKDIRDRYTAEEFGEENIVASDRSMRSSQYLEDDTIEQTVFDYIYGDKSVDLDMLLWGDSLVLLPAISSIGEPSVHREHNYKLGGGGNNHILRPRKSINE